MDERFVDGLFSAKMDGSLEEFTDRQVSRVLLEIRTRRALAPYLAIFKLAWEITCGKYRRAFKEVHGGSDAAPGTSPGTGAVPVAQFAGYAGGFTAGPGLTIGAGQAGSSPSVVQAHIPYFQDAGIKAGEITAYRCWKLGGDGLLHSVIIEDFVWEPGKIVEGNPSDMSEGIYAFKSVLMLHEYGSPEKGTVTGTVDMWGDVYEHERGYRAQYAAISSIDESPYYDARGLRKLYGLNRRKKKK